MGGYGPELAELYDQVVSDDREDVSFYVDLASDAEALRASGPGSQTRRDADGPVLELACGTGRIYLELLGAGVDADGIDLSEGALDILRESAADAGLEPSVRRADVTEFSTDREYDLVICPFNALQHARTIEEQLSCLESVYDALATGGRFVFDVFVPGFDVICEEYGTWETSDVQFRGESHELRSRTRVVDEVEQEIRVENEAYDADGDRVFAERQTLKLLPKREVELLARLSPFESWGVAGGFERPTPAPGGRDEISDGDAVQLWMLQKDAN